STHYARRTARCLGAASVGPALLDSSSHLDWTVRAWRCGSEAAVRARINGKRICSLASRYAGGRAGRGIARGGATCHITTRSGTGSRSHNVCLDNAVCHVGARSGTPVGSYREGDWMVRLSSYCASLYALHGRSTAGRVV